MWGCCWAAAAAAACRCALTWWLAISHAATASSAAPAAAGCLRCTAAPLAHRPAQQHRDTDSRVALSHRRCRRSSSTGRRWQQARCRQSCRSSRARHSSRRRASRQGRVLLRWWISLMSPEVQAGQQGCRRQSRSLQGTGQAAAGPRQQQLRWRARQVLHRLMTPSSPRCRLPLLRPCWWWRATRICAGSWRLWRGEAAPP